MWRLLIVTLFFGYSFAALNNWEQLFVKTPSAKAAREHLKYYTSAPHPAGTPEDYDTVLYTQQHFQKLGFQAEIDTNNVFLNYPKHRKVSVVSPNPYEMGLNEGFFPGDPTSRDPRIIPTFHGYAASGNVTAEVVYVNYGRLEDYTELEKNSVSVEGKIVIVRYGQIFRGTKVWLAQLHGAVGCLIYSDPQDDGYVKGTPYIDGPWRPERGVQRGSVQFLSLCPGDPTNKLCKENASQNYTDFIPKIPSQPISWGDAQYILQDLTGVVISDWQGGLNFTYHVGPGVTVNMDISMDYVTTPIWNVIATIPGESEETIMIGNHRDAWVFGATDPNSGTAALLEVAKGFSTLLKAGWKPKRTIVMCSWDGEEYGLLGSTAYADKNAALIQKNVVTYINVDVGVGGKSLYADATHSLDNFIISVADDIIDPDTNKPLSQVWDKQISTLGSGSDFTSYIDHYGISVITFGFVGDSENGVYHSNYDSFHWMELYGDPDYVYHVACAQFWGLLTIRLVDAEVLPFQYTRTAQWLSESYQEALDVIQQNGGSNQVTLTDLQQAIKEFEAAAVTLEAAIAGGVQNLSALNSKLYLAERQFLGSGLPKRPYYKHVLQAPGLYLGYDSQSFPGILFSSFYYFCLFLLRH
eukprot:TRINITY_DN5843_c0_g1_i1.p1 TRINITY_DN5843_c0_g1~~TRINITY_DN5843_c0_g1_i1.p1  ORF type:complete len:638 (-),score=112.15 TRINITY_DN5843_c0_g1_i1:159-2072(-)